MADSGLLDPAKVYGIGWWLDNRTHGSTTGQPWEPEGVPRGAPTARLSYSRIRVPAGPRRDNSH